MRPLKNGCRPNREIQLAFVAAVEPTLACRNAILTGASWAGDPLRPKAVLKVNPRCPLVGEHCEKLEGRNCALAHGLIVDNSLEGVKYYFGLKVALFSIFLRLYGVLFSLGGTESIKVTQREKSYDSFRTIESGNACRTCGTGERSV
jgi:hypothetical protein